MASFFEKLKKGMGIEGPVEEKPKKIEEKPKLLKRKKQLKKLEIKAEMIKPTLEKEKIEEKEEVKEVKKEIKKPSFAPASALALAGEKATEGKEKWFEPEGQLAVDFYQTNEELVIQSTIAGVKPENLDISIEVDKVLIKGNRTKPAEDYSPSSAIPAKGGAPGERNYFYQECYWGPFSREIILPEEADSNRAEATMKEGILTIRIPKIERKKKKKIIVKG